uniref:Uncharacterized protein n=1 Tax=Timema poppense TaxID=170557 RepID=A0A7R9H9Q4_TIMPO|nr:unnamed protein product [Timema poppensis]
MAVKSKKTMSVFRLAHKKEWGFHNARVNCVAWSPNSLLVASGSLDTTIIIWSTHNPAKHTIIKNAHPQSQITRLAWLDDETLVSEHVDMTKVYTLPRVSVLRSPGRIYSIPIAQRGEEVGVIHTRRKHQEKREGRSSSRRGTCDEPALEGSRTV